VTRDSAESWESRNDSVCGPETHQKILIKKAVCVECLIGKQNKPTLFKVTEPSSVPYRTPSACAKMAAYPDPPPVILLPESIAAQVSRSSTYGPRP
jgi:hypothetical protein